MREIKFRAWDKKTKTMSSPKTLNNLAIMKDTLADFAIMDGDLEWMQYTGLKDKNGKEIYEGDILRVEGKTWKENMPVSYHQGSFKIDTYRCDPSHHFLCDLGIFCNDTKKDPTKLDGFEVIGNIYENKELLK